MGSKIKTMKAATSLHRKLFHSILSHLSKLCDLLFIYKLNFVQKKNFDSFEWKKNYFTVRLLEQSKLKVFK